MTSGSVGGHSADDAWFALVARAKTEPWSTEIGGCLGCSERREACRFGIIHETATADGLKVRAMLTKQHEGGPGVAHGGVIAGIMDEALGHVPISKGIPAVTAQITIEYLRPVALYREVQVVSYVTEQQGRYWTIKGELKSGAATSPAARASGVWVEIPFEHYRRHRDSSKRTP